MLLNSCSNWKRENCLPLLYARFLKPRPFEKIIPLFLGNEGICDLFSSCCAIGEEITYPLVAFKNPLLSHTHWSWPLALKEANGLSINLTSFLCYEGKLTLSSLVFRKFSIKAIFAIIPFLYGLERKTKRTIHYLYSKYGYARCYEGCTSTSKKFISVRAARGSRLFPNKAISKLSVGI